MGIDIGIGNRIKIIRKEKKLSQTKLGDMLGVSQGNINKIESGKLNLDFEKLKIIATELNINLNWLIIGFGIPELRTETPTHNNTFGDNAEMVNIIGDMNESIGVVKETQTPYKEKDKGSTPNNEVETLMKERDMYKMLYEKNEELLNFYKKK